ncbi:hypothetical protein A0257_19150 [Hymenobacter psoromatis]|nr:hypothetical protein A0257_19150 [Hymenobacter psoromatis]
MSWYAYPLAWAEHDALRQAARRWQRRGLLTAAQQAAIETAYPVGYERPVLFLRIGLFGAALFGISSLLGMVGLMTGLEVSPLLYGVLALVGCLAGLELVIRNSRHYRSGLDNALLYCALLAWGFLVAYGLRDLLSDSLGSSNLWLWLLPVLLALLAALLRYADPVVAAATFVTALALLANGLLQSSTGRLLLPFAVMTASGALLLALRGLPARADYFYYRSAGLVLRTLGLAVFYLAGNYLVVREGNAELLGGGSPSAEIPLAFLFWLFTAVIPLLYITLGLRRHDRLLLNMGLLAVAFSLFTLRTYHALLPPAVASAIGGAVLLAVALAALRYLRAPRHGLTAAADEDADPHFKLETFITAETAHAPAAPEAGFQFGGGHSGGGGAEGQF